MWTSKTSHNGAAIAPQWMLKENPCPCLPDKGMPLNPFVDRICCLRRVPCWRLPLLAGHSGLCLSGAREAALVYFRQFHNKQSKHHSHRIDPSTVVKKKMKDQSPASEIKDSRPMRFPALRSTTICIMTVESA